MKTLKAVRIEIPEGFSLKAYGPMGRGSNAKRRAGDIAQSMLWRNDFGAQFDTLVRYSGGLNSLTF